MTWSICSMPTGHSRTHAPQVTQSHTMSSVTAFGTMGGGAYEASASAFGPSAIAWSRIAMISSFGDRALPVA